MPVPNDLAWTVNPRADVLALLDSAERDARDAGIEQVETFARVGATAPTPSSTWPRSRAAT